MLSLFKPQLMLKQHALGVSIDDMAERNTAILKYITDKHSLKKLAIALAPMGLIHLKHAHRTFGMPACESDKASIDFQSDQCTGLEP